MQEINPAKKKTKIKKQRIQWAIPVVNPIQTPETTNLPQTTFIMSDSDSSPLQEEQNALIFKNRLFDFLRHRRRIRPKRNKINQIVTQQSHLSKITKFEDSFSTVQVCLIVASGIIALFAIIKLH